MGNARSYPFLTYLEYTIYNFACARTHTNTALSNIIGRFKTSQYQYHPTLAQISWEAVKEDDKTVSGYTVWVEGPDSTQVIPRSNKITFVEISNLRPSTQYTFKVSAEITVAGTPPQRGELIVLRVPKYAYTMLQSMFI